MSACPVCSEALDAPRTVGQLTACLSCSARVGAHMLRPGDQLDEGSVCAACRRGEEDDETALHCARAASGFTPDGFPTLSAPPYREAALAWSGESGAVLAASDGWAGLEGALTGLCKGLSRALPRGVVAHVGLFDGLDDRTNQPAQLLGVFLVFLDLPPPGAGQAIDGAMATLGLRPQGLQPLAPASPVPIVFGSQGVGWRTWVTLQGAPAACFLERDPPDRIAWVATRDWARLSQVGGFADGDILIENY